MNLDDKPTEIRDTLLEFSIAYLLENPSNIAKFGIDFFQHMINEQSSERMSTNFSHSNPTLSEIENKSLSDDEDAPTITHDPGRRQTVFNKPINPETCDNIPSIVHPKSDDQRSRLAEAIKHILLFRSLEDQQMQEVLDAMFEYKVKREDFVIKQGEDGDYFYVIESGKYKVYVQRMDEPSPRPVGDYHNSGFFGELALMYNVPRAATVQAKTDGALWAMDRETFQRIVLNSEFKKKKIYESLLNQFPVLTVLEDSERMNLADALVPRTYVHGEEIIHQGEVGDCMYFIEEGIVRVIHTDRTGKATELTRSTKGEYFGELALITRKPRRATVVAEGNVKLACLHVEAFERLLGPCVEVMKKHYDKLLKE